MVFAAVPSQPLVSSPARAVAGHAWFFEAPGNPLQKRDVTFAAPQPGHALVEVIGCGLCHTDLGFCDGSVRTKHPLPLVLGHEVVGQVVGLGDGADASLQGATVVVPAVLPCGQCLYCDAGRSNACYLDLPQNFAWEVGGRFYRGELLRIANELTHRGARPLEDTALREALHADNQRGERLIQLRELRAAEPWRLPASEVYSVVRAGTLMTAADHTQMLDAYLAGVLRRPMRALDTVKVVLVGAFCEQPPLDLIKALEKAGCDIVDDDLQHGLHAIDAPYDESEPDPLTALARAWTEHGAAQASRFVRDGEKKGQALVAKVRACGADGVVFAAASFCDPALLDQPMLETAMNEASTPFTAFKFSENTGQFQVIREQAGAFSDAVKLWSVAA
jgi:bcr-type benzoyl-CoA reductase subunit C